MLNCQFFKLIFLYFYLNLFETKTFVLKSTEKSFASQYRNKIAKYLFKNRFFPFKVSEFKCYLFSQYFDDLYSLGNVRNIFNDPEIEQQWYFLKSNASLMITHNLENLWAQNILGQGVTIGLIGNSFQVDHKDLMQNYDKSLSFNFINNSHILNPNTTYSTTIFAGMIAAVSNNRICGVGAASASKISSLQILDDNTHNYDDRRISKALSYLKHFIYIYANLWNINCNLEISIAPGPLTILSLQAGHFYGRKGLGSVYVMSSGSFKRDGSNCAFRGMVQREEIFVVGAISGYGNLTSYSEKCTAILTGAVGSLTRRPQDLLYSTSVGDHCEKSVGGTAGAASIVAGIIALLIGKGRYLTIRQIFVSIVLSSKQYDKTAIKNAAGYSYSYSIGFGVLNATELILVSKSDAIEGMATQHICYTYTFEGSIKVQKNTSEKLGIFTTGCIDFDYCVTKIEKVYLTFTLTTFSRNSVAMFLTSPSGTQFKIIEPRPFDVSEKGFLNWTIKILGFFGEKARGTWTIEVRSTEYSSRLTEVQLKFYGTCVKGSSKIKKLMQLKRASMLMGYDNISIKLLDIPSPFSSSFVKTKGLDDHSSSVEIL